MKKKKGLLLAISLLITVIGIAQEQALIAEKAEMAVGMRSNGKIYVVVAVVVAILAGVIIYLVSLDKKISRLEKTSAK